MEDVRRLSYEEVEQQYLPVLARYARWYIPGLDFDDVLQELRLVLLKAHRNFRRGVFVHPGQKKPASFKTYLLRAVHNRMGKLQQRYSWTLKRGAMDVRGPNGAMRREYRAPLSCDTPGVDVVDTLTSTEVVDVMSGLSGVAEDVATLVLMGEVKRSSWLRAGLSDDQIELALAELRQHLQDGLEYI